MIKNNAGARTGKCRYLSVLLKNPKLKTPVKKTIDIKRSNKAGAKAFSIPENVWEAVINASQYALAGICIPLEKSPILLVLENMIASSLSPEQDTLKNFAKVDNKLYRGSQPNFEILKALKEKYGIKTVINCRGDGDIDKEKDRCKKLGLIFFHLPQPIFSPPTLKQVKEFIRIVNKYDNRPVYLHCYHGKDRTGTLAACYRVSCGTSAEEAIKEMIKLGADPEWDFAKINFVKEFEKKWEDRTAPALSYLPIILPAKLSG